MAHSFRFSNIFSSDRTMFSSPSSDYPTLILVGTRPQVSFDDQDISPYRGQDLNIFRNKEQATTAPRDNIKNAVKDVALKHVDANEQDSADNSYHQKIHSLLYEEAGNASSVSVPTELNSYWYSKEAMNMFLPRENETAKDAVDDMLKILGAALDDNDMLSSDFAKIIQGHDKYNLLDTKQKRQIYCKACYVYIALDLAKHAITDGNYFGFYYCCQETADCYGHETPPHEVSVSGPRIGTWFRDFRKHRAFPHPLAIAEKRLDFAERLTDFFKENGNLNNLFNQYLTSILAYGMGFSELRACSLGYTFFIETILPTASNGRGYENQDNNNDKHGFPNKKILEEYGLDGLDRFDFEAWCQKRISEHIKNAELATTVTNCTNAFATSHSS